MVISGLEKNRYLLFNPVWVTITGVSSSMLRFNIIINGTNNYFDIYFYNGTARFDVGKLILNSIQNLSNKEDTLMGFVDGAYSVKIDVMSVQSIAGVPPATIVEESYFKTFILGGKTVYGNNIEASLSLDTHNFQWIGYPSWRSEIYGSQIRNRPVNETDTMVTLYPRVDCHNLFVAFRNNKGGFSYYLFENYSVEEKNRDKGYYLNPFAPKTLGIETVKTIKANSKVTRDFYETISDLGKSVEIYLFNDFLDTDANWVRVVGSNSVDFNQKHISKDVNFDFELVTNSLKVW